MSTLPNATKEIFEALKEEVRWVQTKWTIYQDLYRISDKRRRLLRECAEAFFLVIGDLLKDDLFMSLSKLIDPAGKGGKRNLSFEQLQKQLKKNGDKEFCSQLSEILKELKDKGDAILGHRNKRIAHLNLETAMTRNANLEVISVQMMEEVMSLMRDYLKAIEEHYYLPHELIANGIDLYTGAGALVGVLRHGLRFRKLWQDGKIPSDAWCKGEWSDA